MPRGRSKEPAARSSRQRSAASSDSVLPPITPSLFQAAQGSMPPELPQDIEL